MLVLRTYYIQNKYLLYTIGDINNDNLIYDYYIKLINSKGTEGQEMFFFDKWNGKYIELGLINNDILLSSIDNLNDITEALDRLIKFNNSMDILYIKNDTVYKKTFYQMSYLLKEKFYLIEAAFNKQQKSYYEPNYTPYVDECIQIGLNEYVKVKQRYRIYIEENDIQKPISLLDATNAIVPLFDAFQSFIKSFIHGENREVYNIFGNKIILVFEGAE
jgi:hypothetical protein